MELSVQHQDSYSRGELLLRVIFGLFYIVIPHLFLLMLYSIWAGLTGFVAFWVVLFTGHYPRVIFEFQVKFMAWSLRLQAVMQNLVDGYPPFGTNASWDRVTLEVDYPEESSRMLVLARIFFGWIYVGIPHGVMLYIRGIISGVIMFLAFWVVLFTGEYPSSWHEFNVGTMRWQTRLQLYMSLLTDEYPPFSGQQ